jgi:predicted nuclease of predicted toxin-antitoxin system
MRLLLDQGLPRSAAGILRAVGLDAVHVGECAMATATDLDILDYARRESYVVVTLDADFHALLVLNYAAAPSVVRIRVEGLRAAETADVVQATVNRCRDELLRGAMISVTEDRVRVRYLPV